MSANIAFNPAATTNALGLFNVVSDGLVQGVAFDDPAARFALAGGILATSETLPMWGGVGIYEHIPAATANSAVGLGTQVGRATAQANLTGFSVLNQAHNGMITAQSNSPQFASGSSVNFMRFGSGARVALQINPALVSLDGGLITQQVSWDYTNQMITTYDGTNALPIKIISIQASNCKTVNYNGTTGACTWNTNGACAVVIL